MSQVLIETRELLEHLSDPNWIIVDCRFELADPSSGIEQYQEGHIPGAFFADLDKDLSGKRTPTSGRHPLPEIQHFGKLLQSWGITSETQVVVYDSEGGAMAAGRLWWLIRSVGHKKVALLNGGFPRWILQDLPLDAKPPKPIQRVLSHFVFQAGFSIQADEVDTVRKQPDWVVIDSRAENRFIGDQEVIDISGGHIPGARHLPYTMVFNQDGYYKSPDELRALYHPYVGGIQPDHCVFYCGSGVTSVVHLIALEHAGFAGVKLFSGSWSEWIRDPKHEIAVK